MLLGNCVAERRCPRSLGTITKTANQKKLPGGSMNKAYATVSAILLAGANSVQALPMWPDTLGSSVGDGDPNTNWIPVQIGGADYVDVQGDGPATRWAAIDPQTVDIVGGDDLFGNFFPAAYWYSDYNQGNGNLYFRIRIDNPYEFSDPGTLNNFAALLNTDSDQGVDVVVQIDDQFQPHLRVEINNTTSPEVGPESSPPWGANNTLDNDPSLQVEVGPVSEWARSGAVTDGSVFHQNTAADQDYFIDWAIPWDQFLAFTNLNYDGLGQFGAPFQVAFGTSSSHATMNKDKPDYLGWDTQERIVPAPGTLALLALGIPLLARRRRSLKAV
jgi:hypothetical protein